MSRIQDILSKAEQDGTTRRTRPLVDDYAVRPPSAEGRMGRPAGDEVRGRAGTPDDVRARAPQAEEPPRLAPAFVDVPRVTRSFRGDNAASAAVALPELDEEQPAAAGAPDFAPASAPDNVATAPAQLDHLLVAALAPTSIAAEQYRSLRTRLKRAESTRSLRVIAVTSPSKGDGKSLTAANLALTMAQEFQQRVLLLDCDLRRPAVHRLFGLGDGPGLGEILMNAAEIDEALVHLPDYHLTVLPAGVPPSHPAELLGSATMRRVLDTLRTRFDRILIDVPPVAPLADLHIVAPMVDGLLMIVRAGVTPKPAIERALGGLDASKVLGLVLNESGSQGTDAYNYEGYGYLAG
jgi:capsular exopolysaccharide synthesis family protein